MEGTRLTGRVKWFNMKSGFGFVSRLHVLKSLDEETPQDFFVHHSSLSTKNDQFHYLVEGEYVSFVVAEKEKDGKTRLVADDVRGVLGYPLMCETRNKPKKVEGEESV